MLCSGAKGTVRPDVLATVYYYRDRLGLPLVISSRTLRNGARWAATMLSSF